MKNRRHNATASKRARLRVVHSQSEIPKDAGSEIRQSAKSARKLFVHPDGAHAVHELAAFCMGAVVIVALVRFGLGIWNHQPMSSSERVAGVVALVAAAAYWQIRVSLLRARSRAASAMRRPMLVFSRRTEHGGPQHQ